jgi:hypothetical protein
MQMLESDRWGLGNLVIRVPIVAPGIWCQDDPVKQTKLKALVMPI